MKIEPPSSTENSKAFDSMKKKMEPSIELPSSCKLNMILCIKHHWPQSQEKMNKALKNRNVMLEKSKNKSGGEQH